MGSLPTVNRPPSSESPASRAASATATAALTGV
jgi:hypothetical protein